MTTPYLVITDGTTTATFLSGTANQSYFIESGNWTPSIAGLHKSDFGVVGKYNDTDEEINCNIMGSSASDCYTKLETITYLLNQAERWSDGEVDVSPVLIKFAPSGSTVSSDSTPLQAVITGRAEGDGTNGVVLEPTWDQVALAFVLPVTIRFSRRGVWLCSTEAKTSNSTGTGNLYTVSAFTATNGYDLVKMEFSDVKSTTDTGIWLISTKSTAITSVNANAGAGPAGITSLSDTGRCATANVLGIDMTGRTVNTEYNTSVFNAPTSYIAANTLTNLYLTVRCTGVTSQKYVFYIRFYNAASTYLGTQTGEIVFDTPTGTSATNVRVLKFPTIAIPKLTAKMDIRFRTLQTSTSSVYIDKIVFASPDNSQLSVVAVTATTLSNIFTSMATPTKLTLDHEYLTKPQPSVEYRQTSETFVPGYSGNPVITLRNTQIVSMYLTEGGLWQISSDGGTTAANLQITATQSKAYLAPK